MIYQRTQPAEMFALLLEALRLSMDSSASELQSSGASRRLNSQPSGGAILEEIEPEAPASAPSSADSPAGSASAEPTSSSSANGSQNGEEASNESSPSTRSYVDVGYPQSSA